MQELEPEWNIKVRSHILDAFNSVEAHFSQVTLLQPGPFRTKIWSENLIQEPQHPAYSSPNSPSSRYRVMVSNPAILGDADKLVAAIVKLVDSGEAPARLPLHKLAVGATRKRAQGLIAAADAYESWSADM